MAQDFAADPITNLIPDEHAKSQHAAKLTAAQLRLRAAEKDLRSCVASARLDGLSWQDIGEVFGITRQAAWERFRDHPDD